MAKLRVLSLNCWGLLYLSTKRRERMKAIGECLAEGRHDVVALQEVWCREDFELISKTVTQELPHAHYFHNGMFGSGICILSRYPIVDSSFQPYRLNGSPYKVFHGDWAAGKGVGMVIIDHPNHGPIHVFNTHLHAVYGGSKAPSQYLPHRLSQAVQYCHFIRLCRPRYVVACGDFNAPLKSEIYDIVTEGAGLDDSWLECHETECPEGMTCDRPENPFSAAKKVTRACRIDFIFYRRGEMKCVGSGVAMGRVDDRSDLFYSDHHAVTAEFEFDSPSKTPEKKLSSDCFFHPEKMLADGLQNAAVRRRQQMLAFYFFISLWLTLTIVSWFQGFFALLSPVDVSELESLSSPLVGLLQSVSIVLALVFWIVGMVATPFEISAMKEMRKETQLLSQGVDY